MPKDYVNLYKTSWVFILMTRVFIIHGWCGYPEEGWQAWLRNELQGSGFDVQNPAMPNTERPTIDEWVPFLRQVVGNTDEDTYLVGHSVGCQTILRFIESLPKGAKVGGAVLVAPWINLLGGAYEDDEDKKIAKAWLETPLDWRKIKTHTQKFTCIFSDNDPAVPLDDSKIFENELGAKIIVESGKSHFSGDDGVNELPLARDELLELIKKKWR